MKVLPGGLRSYMPAVMFENRTMLLIFTILHPLVDALSASVLWIGASGIMSFIAYNFCAFALQFPLGLVLDAWPQALRLSFAVGVALLLGGGTLCLCGLASLPVICACCVGNALFHLSAGKLILDRTEGRCGPVACFISTGALGLLAGKLFATSHSAILIPALGIALLTGSAVALWKVPFAEARLLRWHRPPALNWCLLAGLFVLIAGRSHVVLYDGALDGSVAFLLTGTLVSVAGQAAGGRLSDKIGPLPVIVASLAGCVLLYLGVGLGTPVACCLILFLAQLATGPVLSLACTYMGQASGTAFGFNCLGLFAGTF